MLIDFHTHIFPDKIAESTIKILAENCNGKAYTDGTVDGLIKAMDRADADICITLPVLTKPSQFDSVTRFAISVNEKFKNEKRRLISFGGIHPACEDIAGKMKFLKENGFLGVKIHPDYQNTFIDDEGYYKILCEAKYNDLIVVTHAGVDDGYIGEPVKCPPELSAKVIKRVNYNKIVLGHYGGHRQWDDVYRYLCDLDVYFDTAFTFHEIDKDTFVKILDKHGDDKIVFATDCPWRDIIDDFNIFKSFNLPKQTEDKILYKNALKLLGI